MPLYQLAANPHCLLIQKVLRLRRGLVGRKEARRKLGEEDAEPAQGMARVRKAQQVEQLTTRVPCLDLTVLVVVDLRIR